MTTELLIKNGVVYDPINDVNGEVMDLCIKDGKIVDKVSDNAKVIDAMGKAVTPGKIECHSHMVGATPTSARILRPEDIRVRLSSATGVRRGGGGRTVPTTWEVGYEYAKLGFTKAYEAAVTPLYARQACREFNRMPILGKGIFILMGNNWMILDYLKSREQDKVTAYVASLLRATGGYAVKIVNPGGNEAYKWNTEWNCHHADDPVPYFGVTPREIIKGLCTANEELCLPHSIHLHVNKIGTPGNYEVTLEELNITKNIEVRCDSGRTQNTHATHLQFHAYGGDSWGTFESKADEIAKYINHHDHVTGDSGNVIFGDVTTMTADSPAEWALYKMTHNKLVTGDTEAEDSVGILPFLYSKKSPVHAVMWAIGLELQLLTDPWKMFVTTDHPNGGVFFDYPLVYSWLMSKKERMDIAENIHPWALKRTGLGGIDKEYTFYELVIATSAGPAKAMGISKTEGHLSIGAKANIAIWDVDPLEIDFSRDSAADKLSSAAYTLKDGEVVVKDGEVVCAPVAPIERVLPQVEHDIQKVVEEEVKTKFKRYYTLQFENYMVDPELYLSKSDRIEVVSGKLHVIPHEIPEDVKCMK
ncbi:MAG: formylmethanofuran dehydrogenase subunit A [Methanosarcinales archaeon Met12]|nr:MAG: formylmethanofuran dehydrogenase subunit A [Methanosarcinales archaeon Met12]